MIRHDCFLADNTKMLPIKRGRRSESGGPGLGLIVAIMMLHHPCDMVRSQGATAATRTNNLPLVGTVVTVTLTVCTSAVG